MRTICKQLGDQFGVWGDKGGLSKLFPKYILETDAGVWAAQYCWNMLKYF